MQPLPLQAQSLGKDRITTVGGVTDAGVVQRGEVHPNLMGAAGFQMNVEQTRGPEHLGSVVMGNAVPAALDDGEFPVATPMPTDRRIDRSAGRIRMSLHHSVLPLVDGALLERPLEHRVGTL